MFGLDALTGAGLGTMIPGANLLSIVTKGLEVIKDLIEQGNTKGADAVLGFLNNVLAEGQGKDAATAAEPQPFTPPQQQENGKEPLNLQISFAPPTGQMLSYGRLPEVDGSAAGDQRLSEAASSRIEGDPGSKERVLKPGSAEWKTVMWAMQQHEKIQYDAVSSRFFTRLSDGSKLDIASIHDVQDIIERNGGYGRDNPYAPGLIGEFLKEKVDDAYRRPFTATLTLNLMAAHPPSSGDDGVRIEDLNSQIDELKRKLQDLEAARQVMASSTNITMTVGR